LKSISSAIAQPAFNVTKFRHLNIPLPPLAEQRRIVAKIDALFSRLDKGVETLQAIQQQLRMYRQAVLKWAFEGKLTAEWRHTNEYTKKEVSSAFISCVKSECGKNYDTLIDPDFPVYDLPQCWQWVSIGNLSKGIEYGGHRQSLIRKAR